MKTIKIGLLGLGNIGTGSYKTLEMNRDEIEKSSGLDLRITKILEKDTKRKRDVTVSPEQFTQTPSEIFNDPEIKIVIELLGGIEPAATYMQTAMAGQFIGFIAFMLFVLWVAYNGIDQIKWVQNIGSPILIVLMIALCIWSARVGTSAGFSFGDIMNQPNNTTALNASGGFALVFLSGLMGNIAFWATVALNIPDFSRYAKSQKVQLAGQFLGMPAPMFFCAFTGAVYAQAATLSNNAKGLTQGMPGWKNPFDVVSVLYGMQNKIVVFIVAIGVIMM